VLLDPFLVAGRGARSLGKGDVQSLAAVHDVLAHQPLGERCVAARDGVNDRLVVPGRDRDRVGVPGERLASVQVELVDDPAIVGRQRAIPRGVGKHVVKFEIEREIGIRAARASDGVHTPDDFTQPRECRGLDALRGEPADQAVERGAHLVDLVRFVERDLADEHAAVLFGAHEAGLLERAECFAHRSARDAQHIGDRFLVELGSGDKVAGDDHPLELVRDECGQRIRLQKGDGVRRAGRFPRRPRRSGNAQCARGDGSGFLHLAIRPRRV